MPPHCSFSVIELSHLGLDRPVERAILDRRRHSFDVAAERAVVADALGECADVIVHRPRSGARLERRDELDGLAAASNSIASACSAFAITCQAFSPDAFPIET